MARPPVQAALRTAQVRILFALFKARGPLSRARICEAVADDFPTARKFQSWLSAPLGQVDQDDMKQREEKEGYPSLLSLGMVTTKVLDIDGKGERVFEITQRGKEALSRLLDTSKL
jgi:hypothetical protein